MQGTQIRWIVYRTYMSELFGVFQCFVFNNCKQSIMVFNNNDRYCMTIFRVFICFFQKSYIRCFDVSCYRALLIFGQNIDKVANYANNQPCLFAQMKYKFNTSTPPPLTPNHPTTLTPLSHQSYPPHTIIYICGNK